MKTSSITPLDYLWLRYVNFLSGILHTTNTTLHFSKTQILIKGTPEQLRIALFKIDYMASQEYTIKQLDYSQNQFQHIVNSQEWKRLQQKYRGLCILTREQLFRQMKELKEQTGFNTTLNVASLVLWVPLKKEQKIMEQVRHLVFKEYTVTLDYGDFLYLYMQGCDDIIQITDTGENVEVTLTQQVKEVNLQLFPFEMSHLCDDLYKFIVDLQTVLKTRSLDSQLYLLSQFKQIAKQIDSQYNTKIIKYLNNIKYLECLFYINQNAKKVINDVIELRLKYNALMQQKSPYLKKYELSIYDNHFGMSYQSIKFDQNDFQQYLATNCNTHYQIKSFQNEQTLEFVVQLKKWNHEIRSQLLQLLNEYMNYEFCFIMNYQNPIADHLGEKYDCQIESFRSNTEVRGIVETYNEEYKQLIYDNEGQALVIRICYLVHSLKQALIEEIKSYNLDISSVESADDTYNNSTADQLFFIENMESNEGSTQRSILDWEGEECAKQKVQTIRVLLHYNQSNSEALLKLYKMYKQQLRIGTLEVLWLENTKQFYYLCAKHGVSILYADKCVFIKGSNCHLAQQEIEHRLAQYQVELLNMGPYSREIYSELCQKYEGLWITNYRELAYLLQTLRERHNYTAQLPNLPPDYMIMWLPKNLKDKILSMLYSKRINITAKETLTFLLVLDFARIESEFGVELRIQQRGNQFFMILEGNKIERPLRIINETLQTRVLFQYFHPDLELTSDDLDYCEKQLSRYRVSLFSYSEVASKQLDCDEFISDQNSTFVFAPVLEQNLIIDQLTLLLRKIDSHPKIQRQENKLLLINQEQFSNFVRKVYSDEECYQIVYKNEKDNFDLKLVQEEFFKFIKDHSYISIEVNRDSIRISTKEQYQKFCAICDEFFVGIQYVIFSSKAQNYLEHLKKEYSIEYKRTSCNGQLTKSLYELIDNDDDGYNFACKIWNYLCYHEEFKTQLEQIDIIEEVQVQQESGHIKVLSQNQIEYLQSQQIEFINLAFYGKYMNSRFNFVKLDSPLKNEIQTELLQIAYKEVESYVQNSPSLTQINQFCWKIHIQQNALLFYKNLVRELLNYEGDLQESKFKLREIFIDIGSQQISNIDDVQQILKDPTNLVSEKPPFRNYLTALTYIFKLPLNASQLNLETTLIRDEQRSNKNIAKVVPRGSKEISNILGDRRSSYNIDGYDRVEEITIEQQKSIPLIDKAVIVLVVLFTLLVFINFSFTSNDASTNSDINETLFIVKIIELVILILFVLEISVRCWDQGFMTYFSDWWSIFDALIIIASIILIILDLNLDGGAFTTISKVLRGIFRFLRLFLVFRKYNQVKKINNAGARYNVRSPVEKVIEIMRDLADQFEDPDIIKQLNWGITHISNNTVYEPIIEGKKSEALGWLNQPQHQVAQDLKRSMSGDVLFGDDAHVPEVLVKDFDLNILNLDYDYFALYQKYDSAILTHLMCYYFQKHQLFSTLRISPDSFKKCVDRLGTSYHKENLYHNVIHAFDVTHTVYFFIERCNFKEVGKLSNLDYAVLLLAASAHDVDHPGLNNIFLANSRHDLAMTYNDKSPLEQHHAATLFKYIRDSDLLIHFTLTDLKYFREKVINMILSTDNAMHGKDYNKLKARLASNDFDPGSKDKGICFDTLLHAADISNPFKPMKNYEQWTFRVLGEFWLQGDREKDLGLPVTMLCDRRTTNVAKSQVGFIDFMVLPYYNTLTQILPALGEFLEQITENKKAWAEQIDHYQTLMNTQ